MVLSIRHVKALRPSFGVSKSHSCNLFNTVSTRESSTIVIIAEASEGQAWEPKCGSPSLVPLPWTSLQEVKPLQLFRWSISIIRS